MEEKEVEHVVFDGMLKAEPKEGYEYSKESRVILLFRSKSIHVNEGFTSIGFEIKVENEDGTYTGIGCFNYFYETDAGDVVAEAVLTADGKPLNGAVVGSNGHVVKVEYDIEGDDGDDIETGVYLVSDLELDGEFDLHEGSISNECKVDEEEFFHYMNALELLVYETVGYENLVSIVEDLKLKNNELSPS